jgi:hypothetical protein
VERASKIVRLIAVLIAVFAYGVTAWLFARRMLYPYDLEWMEGGMLCHSLRLLEGRPIYGPPSVEFIPYLYTPLYPALLAGMGKILGLRYAIARFVSIASFFGATWLGYRFAARNGGSRAAAAGAMAIPTAAFVKTGSFYDMARPDSLWLLLVTAGLLLLYRAARDDEGKRRTDRKRHLVAAVAAALLVAAFFTKQIASPLMIAAAVALLLLDWRLTPAFGGSLAAIGLPALWISNKVTGGWFWRYVFELHQQHSFFADRAFKETPIELLKIVGPALLLVPWALARRRSPALLYAAWLGGVGMVVACVAFGTQWAYENAYIPGVFFPSLAIAVAAGRLVTANPHEKVPRLRPALVYAIGAASIVLLKYDPRNVCQPGGACRPLVPTAEDRAAGDRLIERLRAAPGEVFIPFHPFYGHLAGKKTWLHRMGVMDIWRAGMGSPQGLYQATREHRWSMAVFDDKIGGTWFTFPGFLQEYEEVTPQIGPPVVSGSPTQPRQVFVPRTPKPPPPPPPAIDREIQ